jgi:hypothetical protein
MSDSFTSPFSGSAPTGSPASAHYPLRHSGFWLTSLLVLAAAVSGASALALTVWIPRESHVLRPPPPVPSAMTAAATPASPLLPGFQKRGNTWIGDIRTTDGSTIRLVIDARNQMIIGHRVIEPAVSPKAERP